VLIDGGTCNAMMTTTSDIRNHNLTLELDILIWNISDMDDP
jgi:hypothetical protein